MIRRALASTTTLGAMIAVLLIAQAPVAGQAQSPATKAAPAKADTRRREVVDAAAYARWQAGPARSMDQQYRHAFGTAQGACRQGVLYGNGAAGPCQARTRATRPN